MLPKKQRLVKKNDFARIFKGGKKSVGRFFSFYFQDNQLDFCRCAIIVSNKVSKRANQRNLLKRRMREIFYKNLSKFSKNIDIIISFFPASLDQKYSDLEENFISLASKNKLLK